MLTVEEFERLADTADETFYELDEGKLVHRPDLSFGESVIRGKVERLLGNHHIESHRDQGFAVGWEGFRLFERTVRRPDIALVGPDQRNSISWDREVQPFAPKLVIEIASPTNTVREINRKLRQYLDSGVAVVLIMFPDLKEIHIYAANERPQILTADDNLALPAVLPGFTARVADLFEI